MHFTLLLMLVAGTCNHFVLAASGSVCSSGIYKALLPLSSYAPAESYCSSKYPLPKVTVTSTVTPMARRDLQARGTQSVSTTTGSSKKTTTTTVKTVSTKTTSVDARQSQWSSILSMAGNIISTACSCIETPVTTTVTVTAVSPTPTGDNSACMVTLAETGVKFVGEYAEFFSGRGVQTNPATDSGNIAGQTPMTNTFPGSYTICNAVLGCGYISYQNNYNTDTGAADYNSFDLHYDILEDQWVCISYPGLSQSSDFSVPNPDVANAYGYNFIGAYAS